MGMTGGYDRVETRLGTGTSEQEGRSTVASKMVTCGGFEGTAQVAGALEGASQDEVPTPRVAGTSPGAEEGRAAGVFQDKAQGGWHGALLRRGKFSLLTRGHSVAATP